MKKQNNMRKKLKPLGDRVLVEFAGKGEIKSKGGIILTDSVTRGTTVFGKVLMVGDGIYTQSGIKIPMTVKPGDMVLYKKDMIGDKIKVDDKEYLLFREQDLLMVDSL